jgi:hypothetical protein
MLDVHPIHGAHGVVSGWRDFLIHIVIVAIGLGLALSLQQSVEYLHHRHQLAETRRALRQEREDNRRAFATQTDAWRYQVAELENNLLVIEDLRQHPRTPHEKLPGVPRWWGRAMTFTTPGWNAAQQAGAIALMSRQEIEPYSDLYGSLAREWDAAVEAVIALLAAERSNLLDGDPSHLTPEKVDAEVDLLLAALEKEWLLGSEMVNLVEARTDFPATVTRAELHRLRHWADEETLERLAPAEALTTERLKAAGIPDKELSRR